MMLVIHTNPVTMRYISSIIILPFLALAVSAKHHSWSLSFTPSVLSDTYEAYINITGIHDAALPSSPYYEVWIELEPENTNCETYHKFPFYGPLNHHSGPNPPEKMFDIIYTLNRVCEVEDATTWPKNRTFDVKAHFKYVNTQNATAANKPVEQVYATYEIGTQVTNALKVCDKYESTSQWESGSMQKLEGKCLQRYYLTDPATGTSLSFYVIVERETMLTYANVFRSTFALYFYTSFGIALLDVIIFGAQGRTEGAVLAHFLGNFIHLSLFGLLMALVYTTAAIFYTITTCKLSMFKLIGLWFCPFGRTVVPDEIDVEDKEHGQAFLWFGSVVFGVPIILLGLMRLPVFLIFVWTQLGHIFFNKFADILSWSKVPFNKKVIFENSSEILVKNEYTAFSNLPRHSNLNSTSATEVLVEVGQLKPIENNPKRKEEL